jgi:membrane protein
LGNFLKYLFQIILSPAEGWNDMAYDLNMNRVNVRQFYLRSFLPLVAICSASIFIRLIYGADWLLCMASAIGEFVSFFLTYHLAIYIISWFMLRLVDADARDKQDQRRLAVVVMMSVSFIALVAMVTNIIKVKIGLLSFLPFYVVFILWKGCGFLTVDRRQEGLFMIVASASLLGAYYLLSFIFNALL